MTVWHESQGPDAARLRWWEHPLALIVWAALWLAYAAHTTKPGQFSVTALLAWAAGCLLWLVAGGWERK